MGPPCLMMYLNPGRRVILCRAVSPEHIGVREMVHPRDLIIWLESFVFVLPIIL